MAPRFAWVLNLDADVELERGASYAPTLRTREGMAPHIATVANTLLSGDDVLVDESTPAASLAKASPPFTGRAFSPTPRAIRILARAGVTHPPAPSVEILKRVNSRQFCAELGATLPTSGFVTTMDDARALLERDPVVASAFRLKRAHGMTGRGQRVVPRGVPTGDDLSFLRRAVDEGGVQIEPNVAVERELSLHGLLETDGALRIGNLVEQTSDARGAWTSSRLATHLSGIEREEEALRLELAGVGRALHAAAYFGPFGVDAFLYRDLAGGLHFQPRSEINARYSMGFGIGFATHTH